MSLPALPTELIEKILACESITQHDRWAVARVNKALNNKATPLLYRAIIISEQWGDVEKLFRKLRSVLSALTGATGHAALIQSFTIDGPPEGFITRDASRRLMETFKTTLSYLYKVKRLSLKNIPQPLMDVLLFLGQPMNMILEELVLHTGGITKEDAMSIIRQPRLKTLCIHRADNKWPSNRSGNSGKEHRLLQDNSLTNSSLEHIELHTLVQHDVFAEYILERCRSLRSLDLAIFEPCGHMDIPLGRLLAPVAETLHSLKLRHSPQEEEEMGPGKSFHDSLRLKFLEFKSLKHLDVSRGFLFRTEKYNARCVTEENERNGLYLRLPNTLERLTIGFPRNASVVDHTFGWYPIHSLVEDCTWIEELAAHKRQHFPKLHYVMLYEQWFIRKNKAWNAPQRISKQYQHSGIELKVYVRPLSVYEYHVENETCLSREHCTLSFQHSPARDPDSKDDLSFTVVDAEWVSPEDSKMKAALESYSSRMRESNRKFLAEMIDEIKAMRLPTKKDEMHRMARFWIENYPHGEWPYPGLRSLLLELTTTSDKYRSLWSQEDALSDIEDLLSLEHPLLDGIHPGNSQVKPLWDRDQVETMEEYLSWQAGKPIRLNDEFVSFIKYAPRGVEDADFRKSGICGFYPVWRKDDIGNFDFRCLGKNWCFEYDARMRRYFFMNGEKFKVVAVSSTGAKTAKGHPGHLMRHNQYHYRAWKDFRMWTSYYVLCKKYETNPGPFHYHLWGDEDAELPTDMEDGDYTERNGWSWRVLFHDGWMDQKRTDYTLHMFDTIVDFLEWYGSWYDRLDMDEVRRNTTPMTGLDYSLGH